MAEATPPVTDGAPRSRSGLVLLLVAVAGMVLLWGYVLYLAIGPGRQGSPDELDDPSFAAAAQERCEAALAEVRALPLASETETAAARADVLDDANGAFAAMLDDLEAMAPGGEDGELVAAWLADWRTYLGDRQRYAEALREDPDARLLISPKAGQHITEYLDAFAADNDMPACSTPADV